MSAELSEIGGLENADFITVEAIIDGQTNQVINLINDFGTVLIDLADLPDGNVLQFRIVVRTDRNGEYISFDDIYLFGTPNCSDSDSDGLCDEDDNCSDVNACNYTDPTATSCLFDDAVGECGGDCTADADNDGICDDVDDCIGTLDACGICNGPGAIYECGCADIPTGDCDCNGNQEDILGICGGNCTADDDNDGICDDIDDCVGTADACGVCNGPGEVYECGCNDTPVGDCDCNGNQEDALGICGGDCPADADNDGICDNVDDCVGSLDACGVCNGPGAVYECGCNDIPTGDCDCNGNQEDALAFAVAIAQQMQTTTESVTMWTTVSAPSMHAAFAMVPARSTNVDAPTSPLETATAMETKKTPLANVVAPAQWTSTTTAFATTTKCPVAWTTAHATTTQLRQTTMDLV